jgi:hypothetical protein
LDEKSGGHGETREKAMPTRMPVASGGSGKDTKFKPKSSRVGWREYRNKGGKVRYAMDRIWMKKDGQWIKKAKNQSGVKPMTEDIYDKWKSARAAARNRRKSAGIVGSARRATVERQSGEGSLEG